MQVGKNILFLIFRDLKVVVGQQQVNSRSEVGRSSIICMQKQVNFDCNKRKLERESLQNDLENIAKKEDKMIILQNKRTMSLKPTITLENKVYYYYSRQVVKQCTPSCFKVMWWVAHEIILSAPMGPIVQGIGSSRTIELDNIEKL